MTTLCAAHWIAHRLEVARVRAERLAPASRAAWIAHREEIARYRAERAK